ncbi:MAG TPA: cysteine dioxygenase family protein [Candidatus Limnocylindria bacterium]|jgi:cysteine dioxygenase|nr:cysteine dioxygenase family protein [Candidatus Limnocylindria bacterium]
MRFHAIDDLVGALDDLGGRLDLVRVAEILHGTRIHDDALRPYLSWCAGRYTRNLLARRPHYELMALAWDDGARSGIHDHADANCTFLVQHGAIVCEDWRVTSGGTLPGTCTLARDGTQTLRAGALDERSGPLSVHRVGADGGRAVTLHVYAAPIDSFLAFDEAGTCRRVSSRYDSRRAP